MERLPDPRDLPPGDARAQHALERFFVSRVASAASVDFADGYGALASEFGEKGELERREVVLGWLRRSPAATHGDRLEGRLSGDLSWQYHLLVARDETGLLAGARDAHVTLDRARRECVVYLAHTLVLPEFRRTGLASLFRAAPVTLARRAVAGAGLPACDILLGAEMEPVDAADPATIVRLCAYGKAGFRAIPPALLPYCQPDFRDLSALRRASPAEPARPLPLLAVVSWLDHEGASALPKRLCEAYLRHLYAVFATHCLATDLRAPFEHAEAALDRAPDPVPLLPLPAGGDDAAAIARLSGPL